MFTRHHSPAKQLYLLLYTLCAVPLLLSLAHAQPPITDTDSEIVKSIDAILQTPALKTGFQGILIQSLKDGSTLYEHNADNVFMPASNNKLLTSGAALALIRPDYLYPTRLYYTGSLSKEGVLRGNLILQGSGDPLLSIGDIAAMAQFVKWRGIKRILGGIRYDDTAFDSQPLGPGWEWDDEPAYYAAQVSALNLNENTLQVQPLPGKTVGSPVRLTLAPLYGYAYIVNRATTGKAGTKSTIEITRERGKNIITVRGVLPVDTKLENAPVISVTVENPSRYAATALQQYVASKGIRIEDRLIKLQTASIRNATLLTEHRSKALPAILRVLNKESDNLVAECLLKTLGTTYQGRSVPGSTQYGADNARLWFAKIGMDISRVQQVDGSGLSRHNLVSPRNLVKLLTHYASSSRFTVFYNSLPIAGVDGTLKNRLKGTAAENNCRAKTGTIANASSLSGYVTTKDGEKLVFSILMNHHIGSPSAPRIAQDSIVSLLANYSRQRKEP